MVYVVWPMERIQYLGICCSAPGYSYSEEGVLSGLLFMLCISFTMNMQAGFLLGVTIQTCFAQFRTPPRGYGSFTFTSCTRCFVYAPRSPHHHSLSLFSMGCNTHSPALRLRVRRAHTRLHTQRCVHVDVGAFLLFAGS